MIVLQFVRGSDFGAKAIEWFSHANYSHVDTVLPNGLLFGARSDNVGGAPPGVRARDAAYVKDSPVLRVEIPCKPEIEREYLRLVLAETGKPYDKPAILGFITGRNWRDNDSWFCSELVAYGLEKAGYFTHLAAPFHKITPADLILALSVKVPIHEPT